MSAVPLAPHGALLQICVTATAIDMLASVSCVDASGGELVSLLFMGF